MIFSPRLPRFTSPGIPDERSIDTDGASRLGSRRCLGDAKSPTALEHGAKPRQFSGGSVVALVLVAAGRSRAEAEQAQGDDRTARPGCPCPPNE